MIVVVNQRSTQPVSLCCLTWDQVVALEALLLRERFRMGQKRADLARFADDFIDAIGQAYNMGSQNINDFEFVRDLRIEDESGGSNN